MKKRLRSSVGPDEFARIAPESKRKKTDKYAKLKEYKAKRAEGSDEEMDDSYDSELERQKESE